MWSLTRFCEKVYMMVEGGSDYCSKKSDDICGNASGEVKIQSLLKASIFMLKILYFRDLYAFRSNCSVFTLLGYVSFRQCSIFSYGIACNLISFFETAWIWGMLKVMVFVYLCFFMDQVKKFEIGNNCSKGLLYFVIPESVCIWQVYTWSCTWHPLVCSKIWIFLTK